MPRRLTITVLAVGAALLFATGALAALLISGDVGGEGKTQADGTGKGYLGLTVGLIPAQGLQVRSVESEGPAAKAGIQAGDYLRSVDGQVVRTPEQLRTAVESKAPGTSVTVTYERGDSELQATVKLGDAPAGAQIEATPGQAGQNPPQGRGEPNANRGQLGVQIQNITPQLKQRYELTKDNGVVITEVQANSAAADAGLKAGDVILAVNGNNVSTAIELTRLLAGVVGQPVSLRVLRGSDEMSITVTPRAAELFPGFDKLPPALQQRLRNLAQNRNLTPEQLQRLASGDRLSVPGTVKEITPTSITVSPIASGSDLTFTIDSFTHFGLFLDQVPASEVRPGSTVLVLSADGETAAAVLILKQ